LLAAEYRKPLEQHRGLLEQDVVAQIMLVGRHDHAGCARKRGIEPVGPVVDGHGRRALRSDQNGSTILTSTGFECGFDEIRRAAGRRRIDDRRFSRATCSRTPPGPWGPAPPGTRFGRSGASIMAGERDDIRRADGAMR
jgi:hypothetical protein